MTLCFIAESLRRLSENADTTQTGLVELDLNLCHNLNHMLSVFDPYIYMSTIGTRDKSERGIGMRADAQSQK